MLSSAGPSSGPAASTACLSKWSERGNTNDGDVTGWGYPLRNHADTCVNAQIKEIRSGKRKAWSACESLTRRG